MTNFVLGMIAGVVALLGFVIYRGTRPERFGPVLLMAFQAMRLHLGRNAAVAATTGPHGWRIGAFCFPCQIYSAITPDDTRFACLRCGRLIKETSNEMGGTGRNEIVVKTVEQ